jgi:hypothetical protein
MSLFYIKVGFRTYRVELLYLFFLFLFIFFILRATELVQYQDQEKRTQEKSKLSSP